MTAQRVETLTKTLDKTYDWLRDVAAELGTDDLETAYAALHSTLHVLRDRLTVDEAAQLGAQLPILVRGIYYEGWDPSDKPMKERRLDEFLANVQRGFKVRHGLDARDAIRAVFRTLEKRVSAGEIEDVMGCFPAGLRQLWS
jgi:uncharacterized protein (DUF2267 family)